MSVQVMVNGIPGNMGRIVAETCVARGLELVPYSLTGEIIVENESEVAGKTIQLLKPSNREERIGEVLAKYPNMICIDYTHPTAVNDNAAFYVKHKIPFVMGTTGGDREALAKLVADANHPSVIYRLFIKILSGLYSRPSEDLTTTICACHIFAYCLIPNHVHLLLREKEWHIGDIMKSIASSYVFCFNKKYGRIGHLFQDRFKSEPCDDMSYFFTLFRYIHQNPVKAGL